MPSNKKNETKVFSFCRKLIASGDRGERWEDGGIVREGGCFWFPKATMETFHRKGKNVYLRGEQRKFKRE